MKGQETEKWTSSLCTNPVSMSSIAWASLKQVPQAAISTSEFQHGIRQEESQYSSINQHTIKKKQAVFFPSGQEFEDSCNHLTIEMMHYNIVSLALKETQLLVPLTNGCCQRIALIGAAMWSQLPLHLPLLFVSDPYSPVRVFNTRAQAAVLFWTHLEAPTESKPCAARRRQIWRKCT